MVKNLETEQKKSMKEIIDELRKPLKTSGKTYITGIIKEQEEYKKLDKLYKKECKCKDVLSLEERAQLGDILVRDLDGYYEEIKDIFKEPSKSSPNPEEIEANTDLERDFIKWRNNTNLILKKCDLNEWEGDKK